MTDDYNRGLFGPVERFIPITILGKSYQVPERIELLRVFQFLDFSIDYARLCWNGSCHRCVVSLDTDADKKGEVLSCRARATANTNVCKLPPTIQP